jgi:hypothetical protein
MEISAVAVWAVKSTAAFTNVDGLAAAHVDELAFGVEERAIGSVGSIVPSFVLVDPEEDRLRARSILEREKSPLESTRGKEEVVARGCGLLGSEVEAR